MKGVQTGLLAGWTFATLVSWIPGMPVSVNHAVSFIFPHARNHPVMFAEIPKQVSVVHWNESSGKVRDLTELNTTQAYGYLDARTHLNAILFPEWLNYLCRVRPGITEMEILKKDLDSNQWLGAPRRLPCHDRGLIPK